MQAKEKLEKKGELFHEKFDDVAKFVKEFPPAAPFVIFGPFYKPAGDRVLVYVSDQSLEIDQVIDRLAAESALKKVTRVAVLEVVVLRVRYRDAFYQVR